MAKCSQFDALVFAWHTVKQKTPLREFFEKQNYLRFFAAFLAFFATFLTAFLAFFATFFFAMVVVFYEMTIDKSTHARVKKIFKNFRAHMFLDVSIAHK